MLKIKMPNGNEAVIEDEDLDKFPDAEVVEEVVELEDPVPEDSE